MKKLQLITEAIKESVKVGTEKYKTLHQKSELNELAVSKHRLNTVMSEIEYLSMSESDISLQINRFKATIRENQLKKAEYEEFVHVESLREDIQASLRFMNKQVAYSNQMIEKLSNMLKENQAEVNKRKEELYKETKKHNKRANRIEEANVAENFKISEFLKEEKMKTIKSIKNEITIDQAIDNLVTVIFELNNNFSAQSLVNNSDFKVYSVGDVVECLYREKFILNINSATDKLCLASYENKKHKMLSTGLSLAELLHNNPQVDKQIILDIYKLALYTKNSLEEEGLHKSA